MASKEETAKKVADAKKKRLGTLKRPMDDLTRPPTPSYATGEAWARNDLGTVASIVASQRGNQLVENRNNAEYGRMSRDMDRAAIKGEQRKAKI